MRLAPKPECAAIDTARCTRDERQDKAINRAIVVVDLLVLTVTHYIRISYHPGYSLLSLSYSTVRRDLTQQRAYTEQESSTKREKEKKDGRCQANVRRGKASSHPQPLPQVKVCLHREGDPHARIQGGCQFQHVSTALYLPCILQRSDLAFIPYIRFVVRMTHTNFVIFFLLVSLFEQ